MNTEQKLKLIKVFHHLAQSEDHGPCETLAIEELDEALMLIMEIKYELANMVRQSIA